MRTQAVLVRCAFGSFFPKWNIWITKVSLPAKKTYVKRKVWAGRRAGWHPALFW